MSILLNNKLLQVAELKIERNLTPQNRANYMKVVVAGMNVLLRGGPKSILAKLKGRQDPVSDCAIGAVNLVLILRKESKGVMPLKAMIPAGMTLMLKALDFANSLGQVKIGTAELDRATHIFTNTLFGHFNFHVSMIAPLRDSVFDFFHPAFTNLPSLKNRPRCHEFKPAHPSGYLSAISSAETVPSISAMCPASFRK